MLEASERAAKFATPVNRYVKEHQQLMPPSFGTRTALPSRIADKGTAVAKILPVNPQVETNKLLRELINTNELARQESAEDRKAVRRVLKENSDLRARIEELEEEQLERKAIALRELEVLEKLATMMRAMYSDLKTVASFVRDTRESLGGPPLNGFPTSDADDTPSDEY